MKSLIFICVSCSLFFSNSFAQNIAWNQNFNEINLNALALAIGGISVSYERTLAKNSGIGISTFIAFDEDVKNDFFNYYVTPYYRFYLGKKYASGFFLEGFGMLNSQNIKKYTGETRTIFGWGLFPDIKIRETRTEKVTDFALGIGLGSKWITRSNIIIAFNIGVGSNLFGDYGNASTNKRIIGKSSISAGYRF
ncbi:DUF3575 domain-containing protein [Tamlana fucoidanivorans]|uniref:DUF3575 domain-containing protein n=1 Tax=Allotamlana fucoidanivorans TaxID=2583814 RepID=A0A5C4SJY0_9FLAO|nr:DUF3575 domain-containing protein [Tamlana fucoidanivorans]TNJ44226.1 DUF3575 domain-containing protein [Tamlana fucoidanivorans]